MNRSLRLIFILLLAVPALFSQDSAQLSPATAVVPKAYVLVGWSELGMHCIDGKDYSVFSVLPPYNTIHAQLWKRGDPPALITSGVTITYTAIPDLNGSINTSSAGKTNFWKYSKPLFQAAPAPEMGLAGYPTQSLTPAALKYNASIGFWEAVGIPTIPYDDAGKLNPYLMVRLTAKNTSGTILATVDIVVPVSDEMSCKNCHASGADAAAKPNNGWVNNADLAKDTKLNILRKHDDRLPIAQYLPALKTAGWNYQSTLYATATSGTPVLCAACHSDNALSLPGVSGVKSLSQDMHTLHGPVINPANSFTLNQSSSDMGSCYLCHPGPSTQCKRGAMNPRHCTECHGTVSRVGVARNAWLIEPSCQMCHHTSLRLTSTFDATGKWMQPTDQTFATNANAPIAGSNLYRFSKGHGGVFCSGCHNSPHAEFPTVQPNDNVYSKELQGHQGKITECWVCHVKVAVTANKGPHGLHTIGQSWVNAHGDYADANGTASCGYCHGSSLLGTYLSKTSVPRTFAIENGSKWFAAGHQVSCGDCHSTPTGNATPRKVEALNR